MNKKQIKAELRRSACEDEEPFIESHIGAFKEALKWRILGEPVSDIPADILRTFFLLIAEAL